jgi:carbon storage regulator CsrA
VNDEITVEVVEISRTRVKLGVRAPDHVSVVRRETLSVAQDNHRAYKLVAEQNLKEVLRLVSRLSPERSGQDPIQACASRPSLHDGAQADT